MLRPNGIFLNKRYIFLVSILKSPHRKFCFVVFLFVGGFPLNTRVMREPEGHSNLVCILGSLALLFHSLVVCW